MKLNYNNYSKIALIVCCVTGFKGTLCEVDIDECLNFNPCGIDGVCENTAGSFVCQCTGDACGTYCNATNPCVSLLISLCVFI